MNRIVRSALLSAACALALNVAPALAQHPQTRNGFWFSGGLGYGSLGCDGREGGLSGGLAFGGTLSDRCCSR